MGIRNLISRLLGKKPNPQPVNPVPTPEVDEKDRLVELINNYRSYVTDVQLSRNPTLDEMAQSWADSMANMQIYKHGDFAKRLEDAFPGRAGAENIAYGQDSPSQVAAAWMNDRPHKQNMLGPYRTIGIGIARSSDGRKYWVADFVA